MRLARYEQLNRNLGDFVLIDALDIINGDADKVKDYFCNIIATEDAGARKGNANESHRRLKKPELFHSSSKRPFCFWNEIQPNASKGGSLFGKLASTCSKICSENRTQ
jgi:hypothetical protein